MTQEWIECMQCDILRSNCVTRKMAHLEPKYSRKAVAAAKAPKYAKAKALTPEQEEHYAVVATLHATPPPAKKVSRKKKPSAKDGTKCDVHLSRALIKMHGAKEGAQRIAELNRKLAEEHDVEECDGKCAGCKWEEWYHGYQEGPEPECPPGHEP